MLSIPVALFNSKALFNPYQYKPFFACMEKNDQGWEWNHKNLFITDEVGVGKTFEVGIILEELLHQNIHLSVLVICPARLCSNWESEMQENFYLGFTNYRTKKKFGQLTILPYSYFGSKKGTDTADEDRLEKELQTEKMDIPETWDIPQYDVLILDEAHYIRNRGKLYSYIEKMIEQNEAKGSKPKIFLTATPIFNSEKDYDNITGLLVRNGQTFETTTTLQGEANCYDFQLDIQMQSVALSELEKSIIEEIYEEVPDDDGFVRAKYGHLAGFLKRVSASSFHSLATFVENRAEFQQEPNYYGQADDEIYVEEESDLSVLSILCEQWEERQKDSKLKSLKTLLKTIFENSSQKVVIFSCFLNTCDYLQKKLSEEYKVFMVTGKTPASAMVNTINQFRYENKNAILVCSDAIKEGQNFQFCQNLIHYDFPYTPAAIGQRNGRIYRRGQKGEPKVYYMFTEGTYDQRLFGEIIVSKTRSIKDASDQNRVSILNVLPSDPQMYFENCIQAYFEDRVKELQRQLNPKTSAPQTSPQQPVQEPQMDETEEEKITYNEQQRVFRAILRRQFSHMERESDHSRRVWELDGAESAYNDTPDGDSCCKKLVEIFSNGLPSNQGEALQEAYQNKYTKTMENFNQRVFGCEDANFQKHCQDILHEVGEHKFCCDMIENTEMTLEDYKKQFVPLLTL